MVRTRLAAPLVVLMLTLAVAAGLATYDLASRGVAVAGALTRKTGGPLAYPAPMTAGGLPRRLGGAEDPRDRSVISAFEQRFSAVAASVLAAADRARPGGSAAPPMTTIRPSGLYGEPGHLDPATDHPSWIMYMGLQATGTLGQPAATISSLMTGILGPYSRVGPWRVDSGHRGGAANCTVAWLARTSVAVCGWATDHTIGAMASPLRDTTPGGLATLMVQMRHDLQHG